MSHPGAPVPSAPAQPVPAAHLDAGQGPQHIVTPPRVRAAEPQQPQGQQPQGQQSGWSSHPGPSYQQSSQFGQQPLGQQQYGQQQYAQSQYRAPQQAPHQPTQYQPTQYQPTQYQPTQYQPTQYQPTQYRAPQATGWRPGPAAFQQYPAPQGPALPYPAPSRPGPSRTPRSGGTITVVVLLLIALVAEVSLTYLFRGGTVEVETTPTPTATTPEWENDDYEIPSVANQVPQMPAPNDSQADEWLTNNKIYSVTMATPVRCEAEPVDATTLSTTEMAAQLNDVMKCLLRVWGPALEEAGFTATRPSITVMASEQQTACGKMRMKNAMFCSSDQNLYFASDLPELFDPTHATKAWVIESVLAHEYAHAFQGRTGIIPARNVLADEAATREEEYLLVRRNEAQADCLAGMFWNAAAKSLELDEEDIANIVETFRSIGSDRDGTTRLSTHPTMATRAKWVNTGLAATDIGACNTYRVPASEVA
ncbi:neutral zinc metallopeptidase [Propionibacteriaceae bacterium Y1923]